MDALTDVEVATEPVKLGATTGLAKPDFFDPGFLTIENLNDMLRYCVDNGVDDLVLLVGSPWSVMWSERVVFMGERPLMHEELCELLNDMTSNSNAAIDIGRGEPVDFTFTLAYDRGKFYRFRCCATGCLGPRGRPGMEIVMRPSGKIPPTMDDLELPDYIKDAALPKSGIVLICGPTGSGKTTLLDAILRAQATHPDGRHILTYYAPIENDLNVIPGRTGLISQCEVGREGYGAHLKSFPEAVRNSLRRHPNVIAFGEARDPETIEGAVLAAMTGHATYTTTHTSNVHMAIPRMADSFSATDRIRITNGLLDNTRLIVHQRLLKRPDGIGRAPVRSALAITQDIRHELLKTTTEMIPAAMLEMTNKHGIGLLDDAQSQYSKGLIHDDEMLALERELRLEIV